MAAQKFSMTGSIKFGLKTALKQFWFFLAMFIVLILIELIPRGLGLLFGAMGERLPATSMFLSLVVGAASAVIGIIAQMGVFNVALKLCDHPDEEPKIADIFACSALFWKFFFGSILYGLIVFGGLLLFIIPGVIWGVQFQFFSYAIVQKRLGIIAAFEESSRITKGAKWDVFAFGFVLMMMNLMVALFSFGFGLLLSIPVTIMAQAFAYRTLEDPEFAGARPLAQLPTPGWMRWSPAILFVTLALLGALLGGAAIVALLPEIQKAFKEIVIEEKDDSISSTMRDMRAIGTALGCYQVDYNVYPIQPELADFSRTTIPSVYYEGGMNDAWGNPFQYVSEDGASYTLFSYGKDGRKGGEFPIEMDILFSSGLFVERNE